MSELRGRRAAFVRNVLSGQDPRAAAIGAGYSESNASHTAWRLTRLDASVRAALDRAETTRSEIISSLDEAKRIAAERGDADALVRAVELKSRLCGVVAHGGR